MTDELHSWIGLWVASQSLPDRGRPRTACIRAHAGILELDMEIAPNDIVTIVDLGIRHEDRSKGRHVDHCKSQI